MIVRVNKPTAEWLYVSTLPLFSVLVQLCTAERLYGVSPFHYLVYWYNCVLLGDCTFQLCHYLVYLYKCVLLSDCTCQPCHYLVYWSAVYCWVTLRRVNSCWATVDCQINNRSVYWYSFVLLSDCTLSNLYHRSVYCWATVHCQIVTIVQCTGTALYCWATVHCQIVTIVQCTGTALYCWAAVRQPQLPSVKKLPEKGRKLKPDTFTATIIHNQ